MQRFSRTRLLIGEDAFTRLSASHVAVIGLGAVGGYAVEGLARAGIGRFTLVDFDLIQPTNINRQIWALESTINQLKTDAAVHRVTDINPTCRIEGLNLFVDELNVGSILDRRPDILIDAIDSLNPKVQLLRASHASGIPTFSSMGAALRTDPRKIRIDDLALTDHCPLAKRIRKRLRKDGITSGITCVYSTEPVRFDFSQIEQAEQADTEDLSEITIDRGRKRNTLGSLPTITAIFGLTIANQVIQQLCKPS